jgi:drug/metabolite transporter (DMT)-like permease
MLLAASLNEGQWGNVADISTQTMGEILFLALFSSIGAYVLFNWGVQQIGATKASAYINLMPVNALWIAVMFYGEPVLAPQLAGMALILSGVILTTQVKTPANHPAAEEL